MRIHLDPELQHEKLGKPAAVSLACHSALFLIVVLWGLLQPPPFQFGDVDGDAGSAMKVNITDGIPIPRRPTQEQVPVANPVEHEVPAPREPEKPAEPEPEPEPEPEAVPVPEEIVEVKPEPTPRKKVQKTAPETKDNQATSTTGARADSPLFSNPTTGSGGVGIQGRNPFGQGYAWYAEDLQRKLSANWRKTLGQVSGGSGKPVVVRFTITAAGRITDIRVFETSGNRSLDYSAHRAVQYTDPFRPLPPGLRRSSIVVEMSFSLE